MLRDKDTGCAILVLDGTPLTSVVLPVATQFGFTLPAHPGRDLRGKGWDECHAVRVCVHLLWIGLGLRGKGCMHACMHACCRCMQQTRTYPLKTSIPISPQLSCSS